MNIKKCIAPFMAAAMLGASACSSGESTSNTSDENSSEEITPTQQTAAVHKENGNLFDKYQSNTTVSTGNNARVKSAEEVTYRAYFPAEVYGEYEYCFYFSNAVDSTYSTGAPVYVGCETGEYTIISAKIADGGTSVDDEITNYTDVTFDGESGKTVQPGDAFWSDPVDFTLEEGHYIVWEWTITGTKIPATNMSDLTSTTSSVNGGDFEYCNEIPLPQLIGCDRNAKYTVAAIGDSITQGCMTDFMKYEYWSAQISQKLGGDYAFWNCGLGWARSSDAATDGDWLERTSNADIAIVAFGTNDINSGEYGGDGGNTAEEIDSYIRTIVGKLKDAGCAVVVFNAPPQDYEGENEATRTEYNEMLKATCAELGVYYFDFASYLCGEDDPAAAIYGGHPNGEAGGIVSDAFIEEFATLLQNG